MKVDWDITEGAFTTTPVEDGTWFLPPAPTVSTVPATATLDNTTPVAVTVTSPDLEGRFDTAGGYLVFEKAGETPQQGTYTGHNGDLSLQGVVLTSTATLTVDPTWTIRVRNCVVDVDDVEGVWTFLPTGTTGDNCTVSLNMKAASSVAVATGEYARCMAGIVGRAQAADTCYKVLVARVDGTDRYSLVILELDEGAVTVLSKTLAVTLVELATMTLQVTFQGTLIRAELSGGDVTGTLRASALSGVLATGSYGVCSSTADLGTEGPAPTRVAGGHWHLDAFKIVELL